MQRTLVAVLVCTLLASTALAQQPRRNARNAAPTEPVPPLPAADATWFPWTADSDVARPGVFSMTDWLEAPAGRHGRIRRDGDHLVYNGRPIQLWGVNASFANCAPPRDRAERQAAWYASYGINAVRLHKFADGTGWAGICTDGAANYSAEGLDRMDYYVAELKERGIYTKLSANFGSLPLGPADLARLSFAAEYTERRNGWVRASQGALWFSTEIQDLQIAQIVNILNHRNAHTGLRYAEDPAIAVVEAVNENSVFFFTTLSALQNLPTVRRLASEQFFQWLRAKYGTEEALLRAWGPDALGAFTSERLQEESWASGRINPVGNPWFFDPAQLAGQMAPRRQRLLDTMAFFHDVQNAVYDRFVAAVRATGYTGEILASNWQAGRAYSHFLNLHSDARLGIVDRHNYFGGAGSMLARPGSGSLSAGMQQVDGHPFMLSEWIHVFPNEFGVEGPALIGAYGMGLNGWDVSYLFQNGDDGRFREQLRDQWDIAVPQIIGVFPAVARQVLRGDVRTADLTFVRNVHVPSLPRGELGFEDAVTMDYDVKEFGSDAVPASTLAIGRSVVRFTEQPEPTPTVDLAPHLRPDGTVVASTNQLAWTPGRTIRSGHIAINTPATQALVGFAEGRTVELADVTITSRSPFAAIYVTALARDGTLARDRGVLVTTIARVHNTGMRHDNGRVAERGRGPLLLEPVVAELVLRRTAGATVHILDHDGRRTGRTLPLGRDGRLTLDGRQTRAVYYEIQYN